MYIFMRRNWLADFRFEGMSTENRPKKKKRYKKQLFSLKLITDDKYLNIYNSL